MAEQTITGILTTAGKNYIASRALANLGLNVAEIILANIPNLNEGVARNPGEAVPPSLQIEHREPYHSNGFIDDNTVAWAIILDQDVGDFDYNWIGLVTEDGTLLAVDYLPLQRKRTGVNNVHNRSFVLKFAAAKSLARIDIPAQSWMFDYSPQISEINTLLVANSIAQIRSMNRFLKQKLA